MKHPNKLNLKLSTKILIIFNILLCLIIFFVFIADNNKTKNRTYMLSLIPPAIFENANEIIFNIPSDSVSSIFTEFKITKENGNYILKTVNGKFYIRSELIERFFFTLTEKQETVFITSDINQYPDYGLEINTAANIRFVSENREILSDIYFGKIDAVGSSRYVTTNLKTAVLSIPDNIAPFLNISPAFWLDLQIYKSLFKGDSIQSLEIKNEIILRSGKNDTAFSDLEKTLTQLNCIDIFTALPKISADTQYFSVILGSKKKIKISMTPLEHGDLILSDSRSENAYIISSYSKSRIDSSISDVLKKSK